MTNRAVRERLLASTIIAGALVAAAPAFAQDQPAPPPPPSQPSGMQTSESTQVAPNSQGEIVVTGSLIRNPNLVASAPVQVIGQEEVALRQSNVAEDVLRTLPGAVPSVGSAVNNGNGGASYVDLRGLGSFRNLVLLDGNRIAPSGLLGRVDLNNIPLALVQSTQALTGGAATTYGADAVSGVVNFITRQDFSGAEVNVGSQITAKGDGPYYRADVTIGANFDDGKGNAVFSVGYQHSDAIYQGDRDFSFRNIDPFSGQPSGSSTAVPSAVSGTRPFSNGVINTTAAFTQIGVAPNGQPILQAVPGGAANGGNRQLNPATGQALTPYAPFNFNPYNIFQTPFERFNMYGAGHYDISDSVQIYTRGLYSKNTVSTIVAPSGVFTSSVAIPLSNPYLPAALRNQFCAFNTAPTVTGQLADGTPTVGQTTYTPRLTQAQCNAAAAATSPTDPNFRTVTVNLQRRTTELGPRQSDYTTQIFDYRAGVKLNITSSLNLDISGGYGESENTQATSGYTLLSRFRAALYATNTTSCLANPPLGGSNTAGCVPVNAFGPAGSITAAQAAYLTASSTITTRTSLGQARALLTGDFGYTVPFASNPISFAAGAEYRKYTASQRSDSLAQSGDLGGFGSAPPNINGSFDVTEGFGEVIAPIVNDRPFFQALTLEGGFRYSHYKVNAVGNPSYNTKTYKGGAQWAPIPELKFRGVYQRAVRAPNISELFSPLTTGLTSLATDPCAGSAPVSNTTLRAVCLAQGAPAGSIGSILNPTSQQANATSGGNLALRPEKSDSYTLGVVIQPRRIVPGFSLTVDYYDIKIKGAVSTPTSGDAIASCFTANLSTSNPNCLSIRRNPVDGSLSGDTTVVAGLALPLSNLGTAHSAGIDLNVNYRRDLGVVKMNLSFQGNWTRFAKFQASPTSLNRECTGFYSANCGGAAGTPVGSIQPEFFWNARATLTRGAVDFSVLWRHIDSMKYEPAAIGTASLGYADGTGPAFIGAINGTNYDFNRIKAYNYIDLATRLGVGENIDLTITVQNLFDKQPPLLGTGIGTTSFNSGNTYPSTYDALGRRFAVGARFKF